MKTKYTTKESQYFPRQYRSISIKCAIDMLKSIRPKQGKEKPKDKAK